MIFGGALEGPLVPRSEADWYLQARWFLEQVRDMLLVDGASLVDDRVSFLPLGQADTTDKWAVRLRQEVGGVPVESAFVNVVLDLEGRMLALQSTAVPNLAASSVPTLSAESAARRSIEAFEDLAGPPTEMGEPRLEFARIGGPRGDARLAWKTPLYQRLEGSVPVGKEYAIDAHTGEPIAVNELVHEFDVGGTVTSQATPGVLPDTAGNPEVPRPVPFAAVTSSAGTVFTNAAGNFNFPGVNTNLSVTVEYLGQFGNVNNQNGSDYSLTTTAVPGSGNSLLMNPSAQAQVTAQANCYIESNFLRTFIKSIVPGDTTPDFTVVSNPNISATCNAYFDGVSINFFLPGSGCVNTAYSTVVSHELGHWLNVLYGTGNGGDGIGEGNADVFAMYAYDEPVVGADFCGSGCFIRTGTNTRPYCGDGQGGCYGQVHADGEVWMGAAWKIRRNLNTSLGNSNGDLTANTLFLSWMNGFDQTTIDSIMEEQWLVLDDDDGNIDNGTPHYPEIDGAFREQGFPGFDLTFVQIDVVPAPDTPSETGPYQVGATIVPTFHPPLISAVLRYSVDGGAPVDLPMVNLSGNLYRGSIPGQNSPSLVEYIVLGTDRHGNTSQFPKAGDPPLEFNVGIVTVLQQTGFEAPGTEGWTVGHFGDDAVTGLWERVDPRGTGAQPGDDHTENGTRCWVTGQQPAGSGDIGANDVDDGRTTLKSPAFNMVGLFNPRVRYWRWYSNNRGSAPSSDVFLVDVSNDNGFSWHNVETVGPSGPEAGGGWYRHTFEVADYVQLTSSVVVRFVAQDLGSGSVVEAAVDDFLAIDVAPVDDCDLAQSYCTGAVNSTGSGATISHTGSQQISLNSFGLRAAGCPADKPGLFYYGTSQIQVPFGDGFRCVGGSIYRFPVARTNAQGVAEFSVNFNNPPQAAGQITPGSTWKFQYWYRDPAGPGGMLFNLSNALSVPFCN